MRSTSKFTYPSQKFRFTAETKRALWNGQLDPEMWIVPPAPPWEKGIEVGTLKGRMRIEGVAIVIAADVVRLYTLWKGKRIAYFEFPIDDSMATVTFEWSSVQGSIELTDEFTST